MCMCRSCVAVTWRTQLGQLQLVACYRFSVVPGCGRWTHKGLQHEGDSTKGCAYTAAEDSDEESEAFPGTDAGSGCDAVTVSQGIGPQDSGNALLGSSIQKRDLVNGECSGSFTVIIFRILSGEIWVDNPRQYFLTLFMVAFQEMPMPAAAAAGLLRQAMTPARLIWMRSLPPGSAAPSWSACILIRRALFPQT